MDLLLPRVIVPVPKLPSYVKLDMAFGVGAGSSLFDKSRYRSHGTISGAAWATGLHGKCLDFNPATPSYVEIPAAYDQLDFTSEDFSIIARINLDDLTDNRMVFMRSELNANGYFFRIGSDGTIQAWTSQAGAYQYSYSLPADIVTGSYFTVGCSRDGASIRLYRNGVDKTNTVGDHINPVTSPESALIGVWQGKVLNPFDGKIEFLRVFGGIALSASEHLAWHNALA